MRYALVAVLMLLGAPGPAAAQVSVRIGTPHASIGINVPFYPRFVRVPGYPVYYAPQLDANYFFYDGAYWVFHDGRWYVSNWFNGPWTYVDPYDVPAFILRVPVRYYRHPPPFFYDWRRDEPPRWGQHWGRRWERRRSDWDRWNRRVAPRPAPLPRYQRRYSGDRYPHAVQRQRELERRHYHYRRHERTAPRRYEQRSHHRGGPAQGRGRDDERGHGRGR